MALRKIFSASVLAVLLFGPQFSKAQCTDQSPITVSCQKGTCYGEYSKPGICNGGPLYTCESVFLYCCGRFLPVYTGGPCMPGLLQNPVARRTLDLLSRKGIQIAVLGCNHHFVLYRPFAGALDGGTEQIGIVKPLLPEGL